MLSLHRSGRDQITGCWLLPPPPRSSQSPLAAVLGCKGRQLPRALQGGGDPSHEQQQKGDTGGVFAHPGGRVGCEEDVDLCTPVALHF